MDYNQFIKSKKKEFIDSGFNINESEMNCNMFDFQKYITRIALKKGRFAIFADCGLGKTLMQLEWARLVKEHTSSHVLILAPLAVVKQTLNEAVKFGIDMSCIDVINYEQLDNIDVHKYSGVVLDESSILKNFTGKIKTKIIDSFKNTPYKLACTATPSPNNILEIGNHCDFLGVMPSNEMIARWFINDTMNFGGYRLKKHGDIDFYKWVSSWAIMLSTPGDIGFDTTGYELPELCIIDHMVDVDVTDFENGELFRDTNVNATTYNRELKRTQSERLEVTAEIVNKSDESFIVWVNQNEESANITKMIPGAIEVKGSDSPDYKSKHLLGFANGDFRVLVTKKKIAQFGLNYQNCHNQIFCSVDFSFEGLYQAIRRSYRFGQKEQVNIHMVVSSSMNNVISTIYKKKDEFEKLQEGMKRAIANEYKNNNDGSVKMDYEYKEVVKDDFKLMNGDSIKEIDRLEDDSIDFSIFSPPFSNLYIYSDSVMDMGNNVNDEAFFQQYSYLVEKLYKKMRPGRLVAVHVKNLVNYKGSSSDGMSGQRDFRGDNIRLFKEKGFSFHSEVTIWKDPVIEMQRTKAHGLLYKQLRKDSSFSRNGMAEYLLIFRKWAKTEKETEKIKPVRKFDSNDYKKELDSKGYKDFVESCGDHVAKIKDWSVWDWQECASPTWESKCTTDDLLNMINNQQSLIDYLMSRGDVADNYAAPVWMDINQTKVLNVKQARNNRDEKHICPLQLDVIEKAINLWTNPNDLVFTPFLGIGSEIYQALKMGRRGIGIELKPEYFEKAVKNCEEAAIEAGQPQLI